jgi:hypothetical protein
MIKRISILLLAILNISSVALAQSPPPNDECYDATISYVGTTSFDSTDATPSWQQDPDENQCSGTYLTWNNSPDIWFKFTPTIGGDYSFSTCDTSSYDTSIVLYSADPFYDCDYLTQEACNGDAVDSTGCQPFHSEMEHTLTANVNYYIRIGSYGGSYYGPGTLTITDLSGGSSGVWYVNASNSAPGNGTSWTSAFLDLQDALDVATSGEQIWIAQGVYTPTDLDGNTDPRKASYRLSSGVEIYGGFFGNESNVSERMPNLYRVFLTGDINSDDDSGGDNSENVYHVVTIDDLSGSPLLLDGVVIVKGNANGASNDLTGGGVLITNYVPGSTANPKIRGCHFVGNSADYGGAVGMDTEYCQLTISHCIISGNNSVYRGGGIYSSGITKVDNCLLIGNNSGNGGAIFAKYQINLYSNTVVQNSADFVGGLLIGQNSTATAINNIFWDNEDVNGNNSQIYYDNSAEVMSNYNCIQNGSNSGVGNISTYPIFMDEFGSDGEPGTGDEDFRLLQQSPCIDAGNSDYVYSSLDLDFNDRLLDDPYTVDTGNNSNGGLVVDIGAYEHVPNSNGVYIWTANNSNWFSDPENWLPSGFPDSQSRTLFNWSDPNVTLGQSTYIQDLIITEGDVIYDLLDVELNLLNSLRIGSPYLDASATFKGIGNVTSNTEIKLFGGDLTLKDNLYLIAYDGMWLGDGSKFNLDGSCYLGYGELINESGELHPGGRGIGKMIIQGDLKHQENGSSHKHPVGSLHFDIQGTNANSDIDSLEVQGSAELNCSINLFFDEDYIPIEFDSFNLIEVAGSVTGEVTNIYCQGLASNLKIRWDDPNGLRGGDEVVVETTGPILFDVGNSMAISSETPNDVIVADLNTDGYPDIAMSIPSSTGGAGSIIVLWNNGMLGDTWQGFTEDTPITVGTDPRDIEVGDFDGDGTANDLVVANNGDNDVSILDNDNTGSFTRTDVSTDAGPAYIAIGEYVEDALELDDIVVGCTSFKASVLTNSSSFGGRAISFSHTNSINIPSPGDIKPGDVNHDKDLDFIILDIASEEVRVLEGTGNGTTPPMFVVGSPLPNGSAPVQLAFSDLDNDGNDDAITVNEGTGSLSVLLGNGNDLENASSFNVGTSPQSITIHDFDNDGDDDLVVSLIGNSSGNRELLLIRNDSVTTVVLSAGDAFSSGIEPILVNSGDFDQDGLHDLVSITDLNPLVGQNSPAVTVNFNRTAVVVVCPSDIDGSGTVDVDDLLLVIGAWGTASTDEDIDDNGTVNVDDLLILISAWGPC